MLRTTTTLPALFMRTIAATRITMFRTVPSKNEPETREQSGTTTQVRTADWVPRTTNLTNFKTRERRPTYNMLRAHWCPAASGTTTSPKARDRD